MNRPINSEPVSTPVKYVSTSDHSMVVWVLHVEPRAWIVSSTPVCHGPYNMDVEYEIERLLLAGDFSSSKSVDNCLKWHGFEKV